MSAARDHTGEPVPLEGEVRRMEVSEARRLRQLEEENRQLEHAAAELLLDNERCRRWSQKSGRPADAGRRVE